MHNSLNSAVSLDIHLSRLQDSAEMLNLILGRIALQILEEILEVHSGVYGLLYSILPVEHTNLVIGLWPVVLGLLMV